MEIIFTIAILIMSVVIHEVMHGVVADKLGDPTARLQGRLTLNPLKHLDPFGSVILPIAMALIGGIVFGWAKPVPYNPYNLKNPERDGALIAVAGPLSNFAVASIFAVFFKVSVALAASIPLFGAAAFFSSQIVLINIVLAVFNLVPIPPLDGSKVLFAFLPSGNQIRAFLEQYGMFLVIFFIFFGFRFIQPIIFNIFNLLI
jgi:Zn-dependent protease